MPNRCPSNRVCRNLAHAAATLLQRLEDIVPLLFLKRKKKLHRENKLAKSPQLFSYVLTQDDFVFAAIFKMGF